MSDDNHGESRSDRARKRAIRAMAVEADVPYSVAARLLDGIPDGMPASVGRTVHPPSTDLERRRLVNAWSRRPFDQRLRDARLAADLPAGRAQHLVERFPPTRGEAGSGAGPLYSGEGRGSLLALLYALAEQDCPELVPSVGDCVWAAETAEETAVDAVCADLDRTVRLMLDGDRETLTRRVDAVLAARDERPAVAPVAVPGWFPHRTDGPSLPFPGVRQVLDALLTVADDGHAPGTRVRVLDAGRSDRLGTIVGAVWGTEGPPTRYLVHVDAAFGAAEHHPRDLVVLAASALPETARASGEG